MEKELTEEQLIDAAEVLAIVRANMAKQLPYDSYKQHMDTMNATYQAERLLRELAHKEGE